MAVITRWSYKQGGRKARASTVILSVNDTIVMNCAINLC